VKNDVPSNVCQEKMMRRRKKKSSGYGCFELTIRLGCGGRASSGLLAYCWKRKLRNWSFERKNYTQVTLQKAINGGRHLSVIVQAFDFQPFLFSLQKRDLFVTEATT